MKPSHASATLRSLARRRTRRSAADAHTAVDGAGWITYQRM
jgi:hypothetical protein